MSARRLHKNFGTSSPQLLMVIEPESKLRFRYKSEGGSHGGLNGKQKGNRKKVYPTVKLVGYEGKKNVYIRVSLYTEDKEPHVFEFIGQSEESTPYIKEYLQEDNTAVFKNLKFSSKKKEEICRILMDERMKKFKDSNKCVRAHLEKQCSRELNEKARNMMNSVRLCFEAFEADNQDISLCGPLYSDLICNQKTASRGELKIHKISAISGSWKGGDDVILLCDKVQKENIQIHFIEADCDQEIWKENAIFTPVDVHYQVAITFKTPPYRENAEKKVSVCLARNGELSKPVEFTYIADHDGYPSKKRKKLSESVYASPENLKFDSTSSSHSAETFVSSTTDELQQMDNLNSFPQLLISDEDTPTLFAGFNVDDLNLLFSEICPLNDDATAEMGYATAEMDYATVEMGHATAEMSQYEFLNKNLLFNGEPQDEIDSGHVVGQMSVVPVKEGESSLSSFKLKSMNKPKKKKYLESDLQKVREQIYEHLMKTDDFGNTFLHIAASQNKNDVSLILRLIKFANADIINQKNYYQETALHLAVEQNNIELIKNFLKHGSNPNLKNSVGNNCYHIASLDNYVDGMDSLLATVRYKPEVNACNYAGLTPLHISVMKHSENCYHLLKSHLGDVNILDQKAGRSLLHYAVEFHSPFVAILLKERDIVVNIQDFGGNTPLHIACATGKIEIVKQLLKAGADPFLKNYKKNCNTLEEENSEDDLDGQTPADVTTNLEILEILAQASRNSAGQNDIIGKLCNLLDTDMRWKAVATYVMDEKYISSLLCSPSPTQALLLHIQKEKKDCYMEYLKMLLEITGPSEALEIIQEKHF